MLVGRADLIRVRDSMLAAKALAIDTETTGLYPWQSDRLFSVIVATPDETFYFDFTPGSGLPIGALPGIFEPVFNDPERVVYMLNAKFDMAMLYQAGVTNVTVPRVIDVQVLARLFKSDVISTSMEYLAPWVGMKKDTELEKWALENGAWEWEISINNDGEEEKSKRVLFHKVPLNIIQPYAENDARVTFALGEYLMRELQAMHEHRLPSQPSVLGVLENEIRTTKALFEMEKEGTLANEDYITEALEYERERFLDASEQFKLATGMAFKNSAKVLGEAFTKFAPQDSPRFKLTPKGKFSTKNELLETFKSPLAGIVQEYRDSYKRSGTYFANYLVLRDGTGRIHPNFRQSGARTGRLSCSEPNLQNVTKSKDKDSRYPVRRCFIAPPEFYWASIDYAAMEYRLMLDYAGEGALISQVLEGLDIHQATANLMGKSRQEAKTLNFMLLYGGGVAKLALSLFDCYCDEGQLKALWKLHNRWKLKAHEKTILLAVTPEMRAHDLPHLVAANELRDIYFAKLPKVKELIDAIVRQAEKQGQIFNWAGRVFKCSDPRLSYKMPNYLIQGGCADVMKIAMPRALDYLKEKKARSRLILTVHDELDLYVHKNELDVLPAIKGIMESVYPYKHLPLTASASISEHSWADVEDFDKWLSRRNQISPEACANA